MVNCSLEQRPVRGWNGSLRARTELPPEAGVEDAGERPHHQSATGTVRSADVTPDNTVLSTQVADLNIDVKNSGAVRDASSRGWLTALLDWVKPV